MPQWTIREQALACVLMMAHQRGGSGLHAMGQGLVLTLHSELTLTMISIEIAMQPKSYMHSAQSSACPLLTGGTLVQPAWHASHRHRFKSALNFNALTVRTCQSGSLLCETHVVASLHLSGVVVLYKPELLNEDVPGFMFYF